jgi:PAS domain S-box-containing protein
MRIPREREEQLAQIVEFATDAVISKDRSGLITSWNQGAERLYGYLREEILGRPISLLIPEQQKGEEWELLLRVLGGEHIDQYETRRRCKDGRVVNVSLTLFALRDSDGEILGAASIAHDITRQVAAERGRRTAEGRHHQILESSDEGIWYVDPTGITEYANPSIAEMLGYTVAEMLGRPVSDFLSEHQMLTAQAAMERQSRGAKERSEVLLRRRDGTEFSALASINAVLDENGVRSGYLGIVSDTTRVRQIESRLERTESFLQGVIASMNDGMITLDAGGRIATVNRAATGALGYSPEELIGKTLCEGLGCRRGESAGHAIERCRFDAIPSSTIPMQLDDEVMLCRDGTIMAVSLSTAPLGEAADGESGHIVVFHDVSARREETEKAQRELDEMSWVGRLRDAMAEDRLIVVGQPIVSLATGAVSGEELLVRVRDRDGSLVAPGAFLPAAERYGIIGELDRWMIGQACMAANDGSVNVNLSAQSLGDPQLAAHVERSLREAGADPRRIIFEITETALAEHVSLASEFTARMAGLGCEFAIDDFGTGYGAFTYLKTLPIKYLKIDIEFVRDLLQSRASEHLVRATVQLAKGFGQLTVAEGVEDAETLDRLRELGVDFAQGFFLGRPQELLPERFTGAGQRPLGPAGEPPVVRPGVKASGSLA